MLVLNRKKGERLLIQAPAGNTIAVVTVCEIRSDRVKIGFTADRGEVVILREEIANGELHNGDDSGVDPKGRGG